MLTKCGSALSPKYTQSKTRFPSTYTCVTFGLATSILSNMTKYHLILHKAHSRIYIQYFNLCQNFHNTIPSSHSYFKHVFHTRIRTFLKLTTHMAVASCSTSILPFRPSLAVTLMPQVHHSELFQYSVARFLRNLTTNRRLSAPACRKASTTTSYSSRRNNLSPVIVARIQSGKVAHKSVRYHHKSFSPTQQLPGNEDDGQSDYRRPASKASDRKQSLKHLNDDELRGNTVFLRCDFNVRLDESRKIVDDTRIRSSLPSIKHLIHAGSRVVLASHLGRPRTSRDEMYSLKPIAGINSFR